MPVARPAQQRIRLTFILVVMVITLIPYQFAYMVLCMVQLSSRCANKPCLIASWAWCWHAIV